MKEHGEKTNPLPDMLINCQGKLLDLSKPAVMGIINCTPDSFFTGSRVQDETELLKTAEKMFGDGAAILDMGGYSSRPHAEDISEEEEWSRVGPAIAQVMKAFPGCIISVDTFRSKIAERALNEGASMVNDISAGEDDELMPELIARLNIPYIIMHKKGNPRNMNSLAAYENVSLEVYDYFSGKIAALRKLHIHNLLIDPGFGFAKTLEHNYSLLHNLSFLRKLNLPIVAGVSRKKMIQNIIQAGSDQALNASTAAHTIALMQGASILRVHDVKEAVECVRIVNAYCSNH
jgi:dihydropteroate synthase